MTTDDGLKGLTDAQIVAFFTYIDSEKTSAAIKHWSTDDQTQSWEAKRKEEIANAARQWLAANVHDSGDGERYRYLISGRNSEREYRMIANSITKPIRKQKLDDAIDVEIAKHRAILAEKGEV